MCANSFYDLKYDADEVPTRLFQSSARPHVSGDQSKLHKTPLQEKNPTDSYAVENENDAGDGHASFRTHPLAWVPEKDAQFSQSMLLQQSDMSMKCGIRLPLEMFDNEEGELKKFEEMMESTQCVEGFSRYYDATGAFTWAKCEVLGYNR